MKCTIDHGCKLPIEDMDCVCSNIAIAYDAK